MIADKRVIEAVSRMTGIPVEQLQGRPTADLRLPDSIDSLDWAELVTELEDEFDEETIRWAIRYIEMLAERSGSNRSGFRLPARLGGADPLWDRDLDG